ASGKPVAARNGPLLPDTGGQQWHYMPDVWAEGGSRLCFVHRFERDAYVAMRVPYTPKYNEAYLASLRGRGGVEVGTIGQSREGKPLQVVKLGSGDPTKTPCVLIYARE